MNYLYVEKNNSFFSEGNFISGGDLVKKGGGTARLSCYGGQFARLNVQNNGRFLARDCWWEGTDSLALDLQGSVRCASTAPWLLLLTRTATRRSPSATSTVT